MSEAQIYAPDYLRSQNDKQLHGIASMIEKNIDRIQALQNELAELKAVNEKLKTTRLFVQENAELKEKLAVAVEALEFCNITDLFTSDGQYNEKFIYNYKEWFGDIVNEALEKIKELT